MPGDSGGSSDNLDLGAYNDANLGADASQPGAIDTSTFDFGSSGSSGFGNFNWGNAANALLGGSGGGMGAGLALGLGALAAALSRNQAPAVKMPKYEAAPVYNRALTAPYYPPQPAPQKSASGQNIYQPMQGMPLFFNPNPFQFDPTEAAKRYGPTPEQLAAGRTGYETGLASLYKPVTIKPIGFQEPAGQSTTSGGAVSNGNNSVDAGPDTQGGGLASGGSVDDYMMAQGRYLRGPGDGMSDDIVATINDKQPARLADGEFVVPADVVADLGNGSSNAGAMKLHDMMRKIRKARHGTTKQPPAVKADKAMPA
jgi:hypothetical protein